MSRSVLLATAGVIAAQAASPPANMLPNGMFDDATGWTGTATISGGVCSFPSNGISETTTGSLGMTPETVDYIITFDFVTATTGVPVVYLGTAGSGDPTYAKNFGLKATQQLTCTLRCKTGGDYLKITNASSTAFTIDNITLVPA